MSTVIPVLGMHRSGTSMITRVLNLLGMQLGEPLLPATPDNPHGYWENEFFIRTNAEVLDALGQNIHGFGAYEQLHAMPAKAARLVTEDSKRRHIEQTLRGQFNQPVWGWNQSTGLGLEGPPDRAHVSCLGGTSATATSGCW